MRFREAPAIRIGLFASAALLAATAATALAKPASVSLATATGAPAGHGTLTPVAGGLRLSLDVTGLPPGEHGLHIHATGRCDAPDFTTAGGHWNPTMHKHGSLAPDGPHEGDLPNLIVAADGTGHADAMIASAMLTGGKVPLLDTDGAALVVHAGPDDYRTDPSGNSGARIACGVIVAG